MSASRQSRAGSSCNASRTRFTIRGRRPVPASSGETARINALLTALASCGPTRGVRKQGVRKQVGRFPKLRCERADEREPRLLVGPAEVDLVREEKSRAKWGGPDPIGLTLEVFGVELHPDDLAVGRPSGDEGRPVGGEHGGLPGLRRRADRPGA